MEVMDLSDKTLLEWFGSDDWKDRERAVIFCQVKILKETKQLSDDLAKCLQDAIKDKRAEVRGASILPLCLKPSGKIDSKKAMKYIPLILVDKAQKARVLALKNILFRVMRDNLLKAEDIESYLTIAVDTFINNYKQVPTKYYKFGNLKINKSHFESLPHNAKDELDILIILCEMVGRSDLTNKIIENIKDYQKRTQILVDKVKFGSIEELMSLNRLNKNQ